MRGGACACECRQALWSQECQAPLALDSQVVVSHLMWVLVAEPARLCESSTPLRQQAGSPAQVESEQGEQLDMLHLFLLQSLHRSGLDRVEGLLSRGPGFSVQRPHGCSQPSVTAVLGRPAAPAGLSCAIHLTVKVKALLFCLSLTGPRPPRSRFPCKYSRVFITRSGHTVTQTQQLKGRRVFIGV